MQRIQTLEQVGLPSFSIIVETENLSSAELEGVFRSLNSIAAQDLSPSLANEVLILESGDVPRDMIERLRQEYPWLTVRSVEPDVDYYAAKMKGVALTTGEVVVLADSDCVYEPDWLSNLLMPFMNGAFTVQVVAGETTTSTAGSYGLAIALTYIFPQLTKKSTLQKAHAYFCNNVAFRRQFLLDHPIPTDLPIYRGNCVIHAHALTRQGDTIWRQPQARACHAAPNGVRHFFWRFILLGYDALLIYRLRRAVGKNDSKTIYPIADLGVCLAIGLLKVKVVVQRLIKLLIEQPSCLLNLPLAGLIAFGSLLLFFVGLAIGYVRPSYFLSREGKVEAYWEPS